MAAWLLWMQNVGYQRKNLFKYILFLYFWGMKGLLLIGALLPHFLWAQVRSSFLEEPTPGNEPTIAIHPNDPDDIWVAFNTNQVYHTLNGGKQWLNVDIKPPQGFYGDPVVKISPKGTIYLAHLAKNVRENKKHPEWFDCIVFERSTNGVEFHATCIGKNGKMQDKPAFTFDQTPKSKFLGNVYVAWTEFDKYNSNNPRDSSRIRFAFSEDDGASFSPPITVSDKSGDATDNDGTAEGTSLWVGHQGELYLVWSKSDTLWMDMSKDGGRTWGKDRFLASMIGGWDVEKTPGWYRSNVMPMICGDKKGGIYVVYGSQERKNGPQSIYYVYSSDGGKKFTAPLKINDENLEKSDIYPARAVFPFVNFDKNWGYPRVIWYDFRNSSTGRFSMIYTSVLKQKKALKNTCLSNEPIALVSSTTFYGDYIGFDTWKGGGKAAITTYYEEFKQPVIQLLEWQGKKAQMKNSDPTVVVNTNGDSDSLIFLTNMPGESSYTFEIRNGRSIVSQKVRQSISQPEFGILDYEEFYLKRSALSSGLYTIILKRKNRAFKKNIWIE